MPERFAARSTSTSTRHECTSQYTESSRTRRAMMCVYCEPKSRIAICACSFTNAFAIGAVLAVP